MSVRPAKRARIDTHTDDVDSLKVQELVDSMDQKTIANLLITAAKTHPDIASLVQREVDRITTAERVKVINFDYLSKSAWKTLNVTYDRLKDSHAFEMAGEAADSIEGCIEKIRKGCSKTASFKTKENGLETLRKIGKSICLSSGVVGREIRISYQSPQTSLVSTMLGIAKSLTYEELERLRPWCNDKLVELQGFAHGYCVFEGLDEVIDLWGDEHGDDESSSDGNEELESQIGDKEGIEDQRLVAGEAS